MSSPANNLLSFTPGTIIQSASVNQNFNDIVQLSGNSVGSQLQTLLSNNFSGFVQSGGVLTTASGLTVNMSAAYIVVSGITYYMPAQSFTVTASKDTYLDFIPGTVPVYQATTASNGATSPALSATNAVRMGKIISGASSITSNNQTGYDSIFNPLRVLTTLMELGNTTISNQIQSATNGGSAGGTFWYFNLGGFKVLIGLTASLTVSAANYSTYGVTFPSSFFSTLFMCAGAMSGTGTGQSNTGVAMQANSITGSTVTLYGGSGATATQVGYIAFGT